MKERIKAFLADLLEVCDRHGLALHRDEVCDRPSGSTVATGLDVWGNGEADCFVADEVVRTYDPVEGLSPAVNFELQRSRSETLRLQAHNEMVCFDQARDAHTLTSEAVLALLNAAGLQESRAGSNWYPLLLDRIRDTVDQPTRPKKYDARLGFSYDICTQVGEVTVGTIEELLNIASGKTSRRHTSAGGWAGTLALHTRELREQLKKANAAIGKAAEQQAAAILNSVVERGAAMSTDLRVTQDVAKALWFAAFQESPSELPPKWEYALRIGIGQLRQQLGNVKLADGMVAEAAALTAQAHSRHSRDVTSYRDAAKAGVPKGYQKLRRKPSPPPCGVHVGDWFRDREDVYWQVCAVDYQTHYTHWRVDMCAKGGQFANIDVGSLPDFGYIACESPLSRAERRTIGRDLNDWPDVD